jgi:hypothetical protein
VSALADQFGQLGGSLQQAVEAEVERRVSSLLKAIGLEVQLQIEPVRRHQVTEKVLADDRHETVMKRFDELKQHLGMNGTGGGHV